MSSCICFSNFVLDNFCFSFQFLYRRNRPELFCKKGVDKNFTKFTEFCKIYKNTFFIKHLQWFLLYLTVISYKDSLFYWMAFVLACTDSAVQHCIVQIRFSVCAKFLILINLSITNQNEPKNNSPWTSYFQYQFNWKSSHQRWSIKKLFLKLCEIFKNTFFYRTQSVAASELREKKSEHASVTSFFASMFGYIDSSGKEAVVRKCSVKKVLRNFTKSTGKHLWQWLFFNKVACLRPATLLKKSLWHRCFPVNFAKFLRTFFYGPPPVAACSGNHNHFHILQFIYNFYCRPSWTWEIIL